MSVAGATAVHEIRPGTWEGEIHRGWDVAGNANGGFLTALGSRAMAAAALVAQSRQLALIPRG